MIGYYMVKPKPNGKVEFTFESVVEMAGWIPTWIINFYIADVPIGTFESILDIMPLDKCKNHKYDFEKAFAVVKSPLFISCFDSDLIGGAFAFSHFLRFLSS
jgi:hypothetical protein